MTLEERIKEAREERDAICHYDPLPRHDAAVTRLVARAEKRLADLEAVQRGEAVEVYAAVSVLRHASWEAHGSAYVEPLHGDVLALAEHVEGNRLTILRGIARKPVATVDEVEAESEDV
jgi:hypothetical protein